MNKEILNEIDFDTEIKRMKAEDTLDIFIAHQVYNMCRKCELLETRAKRNASNIMKLTIAVVILACTIGGEAYGILKLLL